MQKIENKRIPRKKKKENQKLFWNQFDKWLECYKKGMESKRLSFIHNETISV